MPIVLCHVCWCWSDNSAGTCADCGRELDLGEPDPDRTELAELLGTCLGAWRPLHSVRQRQSHACQLVLTTSGLLCLPDALLTGKPSVIYPDDRAKAPRGWRGFAAWLRRRNSDGTRFHAFSSEAARLNPVDELLGNPLAVFVPCRSLVRVGLRGRHLRIERLLAQPLQLTVMGDPAVIHEGLERVSQEPAWIPVLRRLASRA